jgi:hypothetical protein
MRYEIRHYPVHAARWRIYVSNLYSDLLHEKNYNVYAYGSGAKGVVAYIVSYICVQRSRW